jgi:hypothetical protein
MATHHQEHTHEHSHADHDHHDGDTYYLDQICMVGVSGAFGAICLALYLTKWMSPDSETMLGRLLGAQFHLFILASGIALVLVAVIRGATLWRQAGATAHNHDHAHDHDHADDHHHDHDHGDCGHEHGSCAHEDGHHHHAGHAHQHHDHEAADHDHGWAPWRYVVLLVPIILFLLGLPNKGPQAQAMHARIDMTQIARGYAGMVASAPSNPVDVLSWMAAMYMAEGEVHDVNFKDLEAIARNDDMRRDMLGKTIRVRGQFAPSPGSEQMFTLVRFRIQCCAADAIPLNVPIVTRESLAQRSDLNVSDWVKVTGIVGFQKMNNGQYTTILRVMNLSKIEKCPPDNNPYIQ